MPRGTSNLLDHPAAVAVLFHPRRDPPDLQIPGNACRFTFPTRDGLHLSVRCHLAAPEDPHILFFHGNGELASDYDFLAPHFQEHHISLLVCDYRGYGPNSGTPTGTHLLNDAVDTFLAVHSWLLDQGRSGPIYVMGRSLGTAAALEIASQHQQEIAGLVFDSAFADTLPLLSRLGLFPERYHFCEEDGFHHREKIAAFRKPVLFLHGQKDTITPLEGALELHAVCPAKKRQMIVIPGAGHNDTFARAGLHYFQSIEMFIGQRRPRHYSRKRHHAVH